MRTRRRVEVERVVGDLSLVVGDHHDLLDSFSQTLRRTRPLAERHLAVVLRGSHHAELLDHATHRLPPQHNQPIDRPLLQPCITTLLRYYTHPFNGPLSGTTRVSQYQKGKTNLDFTEARDSEWQWHRLDHMQVCTSLQTDNHANTSLLSFLQAGCPSCRPTNSVKALKATPLLAQCELSSYVKLG